MQNLKKMRILMLMAFLFGAFSFSMGQNTENVTPAPVDSIKPPQKAIRPPQEGVYNAPGGKGMHLYKRHPMPLTPIREADGLWSKIVYQFIDVREKINQVLYYPTVPKGDRISLLKVMQYATNYDTLLVQTRNTSLSNLYGQEISLTEPLRVYDNEYVNVPKTYEELRFSFGYSKTVRKAILDQDGQPTGDFEPPVKVAEEFQVSELIGYEIKECWIFDKQRSAIDNSHILAIRPIFLYEKDVANNQAPGIVPAAEEEEEDGDFETGYGPWFYFPELRFYTANADIFNEKNNAECRSFDDIFMKRRFAGVVKGIQNEKDDRKISDYIVTGMDQVLASDEIKNSIRSFEHDLWEF